MLLLLLALLVILALFGAGFALHLLWWVAIIALVVFVVGFFLRRKAWRSARPGRSPTR